MTKLGWIVAEVQMIERITSLRTGFATKENALGWAREYLSNNPDKFATDIFVFEDFLNEPRQRICITDLED